MATAPKYELEILATADLAAEAAARRFAKAAELAIGSRGRFVVALSGGSTPSSMYQRLAAQPLAREVDWPRIEVLWGDERCVPPDQEASNFRMVREALLDHVPVDPTKLHRIHGEDPPAEAARGYESELRRLLDTPTGLPSAARGARIDLVLLGLGPDGHTASLFPGGGWLTDEESWVRAEYGQATPHWRVTLTPAAINAAAEVVFLVAGSGKAAIVRQVLEGPARPAEFPAQIVAPVDGRVRWILDAAAAAELSR